MSGNHVKQSQVSRIWILEVYSELMISPGRAGFCFTILFCPAFICYAYFSLYISKGTCSLTSTENEHTDQDDWIMNIMLLNGVNPHMVDTNFCSFNFLWCTSTPTSVCWTPSRVTYCHSFRQRGFYRCLQSETNIKEEVCAGDNITC